MYNSVEDIDLFAGLFLEDPAFNGAFVGETFLCLIGDQVIQIYFSKMWECVYKPLLNISSPA